MTIDRVVMAFAGVMVLLSITLGYFVDLRWLFLGVFVGLNLFQAAFTRFCPLAIFLKKLGVQPGKAFE